MVEFTYVKLRGRIIEKYGTLGRFADEVGLSRVSVSKKMNGESQFSKNDIVTWSRLLEIPPEEYGSYFFA